MQYIYRLRKSNSKLFLLMIMEIKSKFSSTDVNNTQKIGVMFCLGHAMAQHNCKGQLDGLMLIREPQRHFPAASYRGII